MNLRKLFWFSSDISEIFLSMASKTKLWITTKIHKSEKREQLQSNKGGKYVETIAWKFVCKKRKSVKLLTCPPAGKGPSIWDVFSHDPGNIVNNETADVTCDSYHKYRDDIDLMKKLGVRLYIFTIWLKTKYITQLRYEYFIIYSLHGC